MLRVSFYMKVFHSRSLLLREFVYNWKVIRDGEAGRQGVHSHKVTFTLDFFDILFYYSFMNKPSSVLFFEISVFIKKPLYKNSTEMSIFKMFLIWQ